MYYDSKTIKTICYGFNLERGQNAANMVSQVGGDINNLLAGGCLSESQCSKLMEMDMAWAR